jgi:folate-dependent tRNA-U54 methylase TrmFO/GidA
MNANFGLLEPLPPGAKIRKDAKKQALVDRAQREFAEWMDQTGLVGLGTAS